MGKVIELVKKKLREVKKRKQEKEKLKKIYREMLREELKKARLEAIRQAVKQKVKEEKRKYVEELTSGGILGKISKVASRIDVDELLGTSSRSRKNVLDDIIGFNPPRKKRKKSLVDEVLGW